MALTAVFGQMCGFPFPTHQTGNQFLAKTSRAASKSILVGFFQEANSDTTEQGAGLQMTSAAGPIANPGLQNF